jgi:hypothetical protein
MLALALLALSAGAAPATGNPLLDELLAQGLPAGATTLRLPPPVMADNLDAAQQQKILDKASGSHPLDLFLRKSDDAPFTIKIESVEVGGQRVGQTMDVLFVAHGPLAAVTKNDGLDKLLGTAEKKAASGGSGKAQALTPEALKTRGITPLGDGGADERYVSIEADFLDKVRVTGVARSVRTLGPGTVTAAMQLDLRFANDAEFPNRWRSINRLAEDKDQLGPPLPYAGFGGYVKVTELKVPAGALFVELHTAFQEPKGWFDGPNVLRSKLPIATRENVRSFRRALRDAASK